MRFVACPAHFFFFHYILITHKGHVRPRKEYVSHVGGARLILPFWIKWSLMGLLVPLTPLFQPFITLFNDCSSELVNSMPVPLLRPRCKRLSTLTHSYFTQTPYARMNQDFCSFIPIAGQLGNHLSMSVFPLFQHFLRGVSGHFSLWIWPMLLDFSPFFKQC